MAPAGVTDAPVAVGTRPPWSRPALAVLGIAVLLAVAGGWLWSRLAPGVTYQVFQNQSWAPLPTETQHKFVSLAIFTVIGLGIGTVLTAVSWQFRGTRGPLMLLITASAALLSGWLADQIGQRLATGGDPGAVAATAGVQQLVTTAPLPVVWVAWLAAPTAAVLGYTLLASWHALPTLGARRPPPPLGPLPSLTPRRAQLLGPGVGWPDPAVSPTGSAATTVPAVDPAGPVELVAPELVDQELVNPREFVDPEKPADRGPENPLNPAN